MIDPERYNKAVELLRDFEGYVQLSTKIRRLAFKSGISGKMIIQMGDELRRYEEDIAKFIREEDNAARN